MSGEVIFVLSLEGRYYNCHERAQRARDNYDIVTRVMKLISPSQSCDNTCPNTYPNHNHNPNPNLKRSPNPNPTLILTLVPKI